MPNDREPISYEKTANMYDLRNQPALQRFADAVDNHGRACAVPNWRHEQQPCSVDARLGCERQSEEQYNKEVADRAHRAQKQFSGSGSRSRRRLKRSRRRWEDYVSSAHLILPVSMSPWGAAALRGRNSWYRCRFLEEALTLTNCDLIVRSAPWPVARW